MSMSLRDQLLQAGLISKQQAKEAERQQQHKERQQPRQAKKAEAPQRPPAPNGAQAAKLLRDQVLNRKQQEKAEKKARMAQIKQLIEQNRIAPVESGEFYNFVDGSKIRRLALTAASRAQLMSGALAIVRHEGVYDLIPAAIAARIRERDEHVFITSGGTAAAAAETDSAYRDHPIPDDLLW